MIRMKTVMVLLWVGCLGCDSSNPVITTTNNLDGATPVAENQYTTTSTGLRYFDFTVGTGAVAARGTVVTVHYIGWLQSGEIFDSSITRGQPFPFTLGVGQVIPGWDEGVEGMRVGGKRQLVIPPALAYGSRDLPGIPPNSTLIFEVEVLGVG